MNETKKTVLVAVCANATIAVVKGIPGVLSGSSALLAECAHSIADTANQGLLAAKAGASLLSPFVGRLDDINQDGMIVIRELVDIVTIHELDSEVLAASIRNPLHMTQAALAGAHIATIPFKVVEQLFKHPLTDLGQERFLADWRKLQGELERRKTTV